MGKITCLEIYKDKAVHEVIVKNKINIEVSAITCESLLSGYECESSTEFKEEVLEAVYQCLKQYFHNIGYKNIECTRDEEIVCFVKRLEQDVPLTKAYFEIIEDEGL